MGEAEEQEREREAPGELVEQPSYAGPINSLLPASLFLADLYWFGSVARNEITESVLPFKSATSPTPQCTSGETVLGAEHKRQ